MEQSLIISLSRNLSAALSQVKSVMQRKFGIKTGDESRYEARGGQAISCFSRKYVIGGKLSAGIVILNIF